MGHIKPIARWLATPALLHWALPYWMLLVIAGTLAQPYIGLYDSQRIFFSSTILWLSWVPLPGGRLVIAALAVSLLAKLVLASPWQREKIGIFIAHLGVFLLLAGGLLTAGFSQEGYVALAKDAAANQFFDYHRRELTVEKNNVPVLTLPLEALHAQQIIRSPALPFTLHIIQTCRNCTMNMRPHGDSTTRGLAQKVTLAPIANEMEDEQNLAGAELEITGLNPKTDGLYLAFEAAQKPLTLPHGKDEFRLRLGRKPHALPFTLTLIDFAKQHHPGTLTPRSYRSTVMIEDGPLQQRATITMNNPLRYKGYTVYQSSFNEGENPTVSFAVVKNTGRVFPYVASITLCIGLLFHLWMRRYA